MITNHNSIVALALGNGEVDSSILSGSTSHPTDKTAIYVIDFAIPFLQWLEGTTA